MKHWLPLLFLISGVALAQIAIPRDTKTLTVTGMCEGTTWKAYRTKGGDLWVGCGDAVAPEKSVELRAYYPVPSGGPRR
jgi:hypothetical protein